MQSRLQEIRITHVRMESTDGQSHRIVQFRWFRAADGEVGEVTHDDLARYLQRGGIAFFDHYGKRIPLVAVRQKESPPVVAVGTGYRRDHKLTNLPDF